MACAFCNDVENLTISMFFQLKTNPWSNTITTPNGEKKIYQYDAEHERKRKDQLQRLFERTQEQVKILISLVE